MFTSLLYADVFVMFFLVNQLLPVAFSPMTFDGFVRTIILLTIPLPNVRMCLSLAVSAIVIREAAPTNQPTNQVVLIPGSEDDKLEIM